MASLIATVAHSAYTTSISQEHPCSEPPARRILPSPPLLWPCDYLSISLERPTARPAEPHSETRALPAGIIDRVWLRVARFSRRREGGPGRALPRFRPRCELV